ncbi:MAG: potassium transporter TrkG [Chlamydiota bacterium]
MSFLKQHIHWRSIFSQVGLLLHVPSAMATFSLGICAIFHEWFALLPLTVTALLGFGVGQLLYRSCKKKEPYHLWDAMIIAALGWIVCSILAAIPIAWIASSLLDSGVQSDVLATFAQPINSVFEAFSGLTSTGLTMMRNQGFFPYTLQWWRSLLEWIGGIGLITFILSLIHLNQDYQLYYAEARTEHLTKNMMKTTQWIWGIYVVYSLLGTALFFLAGMPLWEAINHAMTVIATGGFTVIRTQFRDYNTAIQFIAILIMLIGAISFSIHCYAICNHNWSVIWKNMQLRLLYCLALLGGGLLIVVDISNQSANHWFDAFFEWVSALTTCGFNTVSLNTFSPMAKLLLIIGMTIGGATGSTAGGIKIRRIMYLFSAIFLRLATITKTNEKVITKDVPNEGSPDEEEPPGTALPYGEKSERLFTAEVLFSLWMTTLAFGWLVVLKWTPKGAALDGLFDVASAISNVGLTSGILNPDLPTTGKCLFMFLMWVGRLEIIPALVLLITLPLSITKRRN